MILHNRAGILGSSRHGGITQVTYISGWMGRQSTSPRTFTSLAMPSSYSSSRWLVASYHRHCSTMDPDLQLTMDTVGQTRTGYVGDLTVDVWCGVWVCQPTGSTTNLDFAFSDTGLNIGGIVIYEVIKPSMPTLIDLSISASAGAVVTADTAGGGFSFSQVIQSSVTVPSSSEFTMSLDGTNAGWYRYRSNPVLYPANGASASVDPVTNAGSIASLS